MRSALVLALVLAACGPQGRYVCPAPVGEIVRDDCERYRVRYEQVKVELGAQLLGVGASVAVGKEATHSPTELVSVMAHRAEALCGDFNSCRLSPDEYRSRRDELDRTLTIVAGLSAELRSPTLTPEERERVLGQLTAALGAAPAAPVAPARTSLKKKAYFGEELWFGASRLPAHPPAVRAGFPRLLTGEPDVSTEYYWPQDWTKEKRNGYMPHVQVELFGVVEPDDLVLIDFGESKAQCLAKKDTKGKEASVTVNCKGKDKIRHTALDGHARISYRQAASGQTAELGKVSFRVLTRQGDDGARDGFYQWGVDNDHQLAHAWLVFMPEPLGLPADLDRAHVYLTLRLRGTFKRPPTLRCEVDGQMVTPEAVRSGRGTHQVDTWQDRPRYREVKPGVSVAEEHPHVEWWRFGFPLPFVLPHDLARPPAGLELLSAHAGDWKCTATLEGQPVREVRFHIGKDGTPEPHPEQRGRPGDLDWPWWRVDVRRLPNTIEAK